MQRISQFLRTVGPFILGLAIGGLIFFLVSTWDIDLNSAVRWLAYLSLTVFILVVFLWLAYRIALDRLSQDGPAGLGRLVALLKDDPSLLSDPSSRARELWPILPSAIQAFVAWFSFANAVAIGIALVTNLALFATLAVQYLSAERLDNQNKLLGFQNGLLQTQSSLLETQTLAAVAQQIINIDSNITQLVAQVDELGRLRRSTSSDYSTEVSFEELGISIVLSDGNMNPCQAIEDRSGCETANFPDIANNLSKFQQGETQDFDQPFYPAFQLLINFLSRRQEEFTENTGQLGQLDDGPNRDDVVYVQATMTRAGEICKVDPELIRRSKTHLSVLLLFQANAWAYDPRMLEPEWVDFAEQFPQIRQNTLGAHLNFGSGLENLTKLAGRHFSTRDDYSIGQLASELSELISSLSIDLASIFEKCQEERDRLVSLRDRLQDAIIEKQ